MDNINNNKLRLKIHHCSGTIKKCQVKAKDLLFDWLNRIMKISLLSEEEKKITKEKVDQINQEIINIEF